MRRGIEATVVFNAPVRKARACAARSPCSHPMAATTAHLWSRKGQRHAGQGRAHVTGRKVHRTSPLKKLVDAEAKVLGPRKGNRGGGARQNGRAAPAEPWDGEKCLRRRRRRLWAGGKRETRWSLGPGGGPVGGGREGGQNGKVPYRCSPNTCGFFLKAYILWLAPIVKTDLQVHEQVHPVCGYKIILLLTG